MKKIKTKPLSNKPKALDHVAKLPRDTKTAILNAREKIKEIDTRDAINNPENYATDHITKGISDSTQKGAGSVKNQAQRLIKKGKSARSKRDAEFAETSKKSHSSGYQGGKRHAENTAHRSRQQAKEKSYGNYRRTTYTGNNAGNGKRTAETARKTTGLGKKGAKGSIKKVDKNIKTVRRSVKTSARTIKTSTQTAKASAKTAKITARMSARATRVAARAAAKGIRLLVKAIATAVRATIVALKSLIAAIAAGGWIVLLIIIVICVILLILNSAFGLFYANEPTDTDLTMSQVVNEINSEFDSYIIQEVAEASEGYENVSVIYDSDSDGDSNRINNWVDVLGIYAVKTTMNAVDPTDVATLSKEKKDNIKQIFWDMNTVLIETETKSETVTVTDEDGNETEETIEKTYVYVETSSIDYTDAAQRYSFDDEQNAMLDELMAPENYPLFAQLIGVDCYGGMTTQEIEELMNSLPPFGLGTDIVRYALTRIGDPYSMAKRGQGRYVDCSYLVRWAYNQAGITDYTAATAAEQARYCVDHNTIITKSQLQPGDVIFWRKNGCKCAGDHCGRYQGIHHVAIYIGNGKIIEASSSRGCVVVNDLWGEGSGGKWQVIYYAHPYTDA